MKLSVLFFAIFYFAFETSGLTTSDEPVDIQELKCAVCETTISELQNQLESVNKTQEVEVGSSRLDANGNYIKKTVPKFKSEMVISEMLEKICEKMEDFARGRDKITKKIVVMNLFDASKNLNSRISEVDLITDMDMNKSLKYYCERLVEEYDDQIFNLVKNEEKNLFGEICIRGMRLCPEEEEADQVKDEL